MSMNDETYTTELGEISNRITDLAVQGAPSKKILPLIQRSMEIMDRKKKERS